MSLTKLLVAIENGRQNAMHRGLDEGTAISLVLQNADVKRELDVAIRERAHILWLANYLRDQDAPFDAAATEKAARERILAVIGDYLRESWEC